MSKLHAPPLDIDTQNPRSIFEYFIFFIDSVYFNDVFAIIVGFCTVLFNVLINNDC